MKKLWYSSPAACWDEALPLGNGKIGAMFYGSPIFDRLELNEDTLWTGQPVKNIPYSMETVRKIRECVDDGRYADAEKLTSDMMTDSCTASYMPYGSLNIEIESGSSNVTDYYRELDLDNAVARASYKMNGIKIEKTSFVSLADGVLVYNIKTERALVFRIYDACVHENNRVCDGSSIKVMGRCPTDITWLPRTVKYDKNKESIPFCSITKAIVSGGELATTYGGAAVQTVFTKDITVLFAIKTGFNGFDKMPISEGKEYEKECEKCIENASKFTFSELYDRHTSEYKKYFDRVSLEIEGQDFSHEPTNERIVKAGEGRVDNGLTTLLFDYARYLTISCSANGSQMANLQGIWNERLVPPWSCNCTTNINTEMNYWHVETCNLPEFHMPLMDLLKDLKKRGNYFGLSGWCSCHNNDIWRYNYPSTKNPQWGLSVFCGFWLCRHIWEHYTHTRDAEFLNEYFDIIEDAISFIKDWSYTDKNGKFAIAPSTSPENQFIFDGKATSVAKNSTYEMSIAYDLVDKAIKMCEILGKDTGEYKELIAKITPFKIGNDGRILEWFEPFEEKELGHRHVSHLYGFFPADIIGEEYAENVRKSLKVRLENGGGYTGWSNAWNANLFARLGDGKGVSDCIRTMFKQSIYPNMLDKHPPFQIDGNFGICSAICEALMQSHTGKTVYLPALPPEWEHGYFKGFVTRSGEKVDYKW